MIPRGSKKAGRALQPANPAVRRLALVDAIVRDHFAADRCGDMMEDTRKVDLEVLKRAEVRGALTPDERIALIVRVSNALPDAATRKLLRELEQAWIDELTVEGEIGYELGIEVGRRVQVLEAAGLGCRTRR